MQFSFKADRLLPCSSTIDSSFFFTKKYLHCNLEHKCHCNAERVREREKKVGINFMIKWLQQSTMEFYFNSAQFFLFASVFFLFLCAKLQSCFNFSRFPEKHFSFAFYHFCVWFGLRK